MRKWFPQTFLVTDLVQRTSGPSNFYSADTVPSYRFCASSLTVKEHFITV